VEATRYPLEFGAYEPAESWVVLGRGSSEQGRMAALESLAADVGLPLEKHRKRMTGFVLRDHE
jgi:hypothetical protein